MSLQDVFDLSSDDFMIDRREIEKLWVETLLRRISKNPNRDKFWVFLQAALYLYSKSPTKRLHVSEIIEKSGYSRSSFFRINSFSEFQLRAYRRLGILVVQEFEDFVSNRLLSPVEFADAALSIIYSSHIAIRNEIFNKLVQAHEGLTPVEFNPSVDFFAEIVQKYCNENSYLGYRRITAKEASKCVRLLDYDIFTERTLRGNVFPSKEQAVRLHAMFLGFIRR
ncbi:hypothetical protein MWN63_15320 [Paradonghicola geojensis]|nr:hypothetical protein [Marivivens geojensis]